MSDHRAIQSGYTQKYTEVLPSWYTDEDRNTAYSWDELARETNAYRLLSRICPVPFYRYMVRYLTEIFSDACMQRARAHGLCLDGEELRAAWLDTVWNALESEKDSPDRKAIVKFYTNLVMDSFRAHGCGSNRRAAASLTKEKVMWDITELRDVLFRDTISPDHFFMLALGLDMSHADAELFLKKVLLRTGFDYWVPQEAFLSLCLRSGCSSKLSFLRQLLATYHDREFLPAPYAGGDGTTQLLQDLAANLVRSADQALFSQGILTPQVLAFLRHYKYVLTTCASHRRSSTEVFCDIWEQLKAALETELQEFKSANKAPVRTYAEGSISVFYQPGTALFIPKGTVFPAEGLQADAQQDPKRKTKVPCALVATQDVSSAGAVTRIEHEIPVRCVVPITRQTSEIDAHTLFTAELPGLKNAQIENHSKLKARGKKFPDGEEYQSGNLFVTCDAGVSIPMGTVFRCPQGVFQSLRAVDGRHCLEVPVQCDTENVYIPKNKVSRTNNPLAADPNVVQIGNDTIPLPRDETAGGSRICAYLYQKADIPNYIMDKDPVEPAEYARLLPSILQGTRIRDDRLSHLKNAPMVQARRDEVLTATFLLHAAKQQLGGYRAGSRQDEDSVQQALLRAAETERAWEEEKQRLARRAYEAVEDEPRTAFTPMEKDLLAMVQTFNQTLSRCGFHELYLPNPYDCFLAYLSTCEEPLNAYKNFWGIYLGFSPAASKEDS